MSKMKVDFSGVSDSAFVQVGQHIAKVMGVTKEPGTGQYPYLKWDLQVVSKGNSTGLHINHITSLDPKALFNLRNTLIAMGVDVPKSAFTFDPDALKGKLLGIEVFMKESNGNEYANIKKTFPVPKKSASAPTPAPQETEPEDEDDDIIISDDEDDDIPF